MSLRAQSRLPVPELKLELITTGPSWSVLGWHFGPFQEVHAFVMCPPEQMLGILTEAATIARNHFPCALCHAHGYSPERLTADLPLVLVVQ